MNVKPCTSGAAPVKAQGRVRLGVSSNDFNADGSGDILWHNASTGESQIWFMNGFSRIGRAGIVDGARPTRDRAALARRWKQRLQWRRKNGLALAQQLDRRDADLAYKGKGDRITGRLMVDADRDGGGALVGPPWSIMSH